MQAYFKHYFTNIFLAGVFLLAGCSNGPVVTITNHSSVTLSNMLISGSGFTNGVEPMAPNSQFKLAVHPQGETGLRVAFDAAGQHIDSGEQGYFESGNAYHCAVAINSNLQVTVSSDLRY